MTAVLTVPRYGTHTEGAESALERLWRPGRGGQTSRPPKAADGAVAGCLGHVWRGCPSGVLWWPLELFWRCPAVSVRQRGGRRWRPVRAACSGLGLPDGAGIPVTSPRKQGYNGNPLVEAWATRGASE
jgi:hypothetical protein